MRKRSLAALTAVSALGASAVAGTAVAGTLTNTTLTSARSHRHSVNLLSQRTRTRSLVRASLRPSETGGPDLLAVHDINHVSLKGLDPHTGLPVVHKKKIRHVVVQAAPPPAPVAAPAPVTTAASTASAPAAPSGGAWYELRVCESGDNYAENSGNGYYGAYQFLLSTWYALGFTGLPSEAPPAVQDEAARELQARSGWGQWPQCAAKLGLY
jgi:hypothetical protein